MFLPIGDTPNSPKTPYVNNALIAANVAVFLLISLPLMMRPPDLSDPLLVDYLRAVGVEGAVSPRQILQQMSAYDLFVFRHGFRPGAFDGMALFSAMFLHGGWMHLIGNMLFLWIFGDNVEHRLGRLRYFFVYLGTGVAATLFFALFVPHSQVPLVGASGAISGVLGCYFIWFPRNQVKTFIFLFPFIMTTVLVPSRFVLGFYLLIDNILPFLVSVGGAGGVAHGAHIGGFLAGLGIAWGTERLPALRQKHRGRERLRSVEKEDVREPPEPADALSRHLHRGEMKRAAGHYFNLDRAQRRLLAGDEILAVGNYLLEQGEFEAALALFRRYIAERPSDSGIDRAFLGAGKALERNPRSAVAAYQYFLAAADAARSETVAEEARLHLRAIERLARDRT